MVQLTESDISRIILLAQEAKYPIKRLTIITPKAATDGPYSSFAPEYATNLSAANSKSTPQIIVI
jgi:hypothetical protein